jgi:hypothetical protein
MEDGCVLASALDSMPDDVEGALKLYERVRVPHAIPVKRVGVTGVLVRSFGEAI